MLKCSDELGDCLNQCIPPSRFLNFLYVARKQEVWRSSKHNLRLVMRIGSRLDSNIIFLMAWSGSFCSNIFFLEEACVIPVCSWHAWVSRLAVLGFEQLILLIIFSTMLESHRNPCIFTAFAMNSAAHMLQTKEITQVLLGCQDNAKVKRFRVVWLSRARTLHLMLSCYSQLTA